VGLMQRFWTEFALRDVTMRSPHNRRSPVASTRQSASSPETLKRHLRPGLNWMMDNIPY